MLSGRKVEQLKKTTGKEYRSTSSAVGSCVALAGTNAQTEMQTEIKNSVEDVKGATGNQRAKIIAETSKKLTGISNSFTGDLTKNAATTLGGKLNSGLRYK